MSIARSHHHFSLADYEQMIEIGILTENDRVELIRGEIIEKMSIGEFHAACVKKLNRLFSTRLAGKACVGIKDPVRLAASEPEPDVAILKPRDDDYSHSHPGPDDILFIVEVADASLDFDRNVKCEIYAENGIVEYWIINLFDRTLELHRGPMTNGQYAELRVLTEAESVEPLMLPGLLLSVAELMPSKAAT